MQYTLPKVIFSVGLITLCAGILPADDVIPSLHPIASLVAAAQPPAGGPQRVPQNAWRRDPEKVRAVNEQLEAELLRGLLVIRQAGFTRNRRLVHYLADCLKPNVTEVKRDENGRRIAPELVHYSEHVRPAWFALGRIGDIETLSAVDAELGQYPIPLCYERICRARIVAQNEPTPKAKIERLLQETGMTVARLNDLKGTKPRATTFDENLNFEWLVLYQLADMIYVNRDRELAKAAQEMGINFVQDPQIEELVLLAPLTTKARIDRIIQELSHKAVIRTGRDGLLRELLANEGKPAFDAITQKLAEMRGADLLTVKFDPDPEVNTRRLAEYEQAAKTRYTSIGAVQLLRTLGDSCDPTYLPVIHTFLDHPDSRLQNDAQQVVRKFTLMQRVDERKAKEFGVAGSTAILPPQADTPQRPLTNPIPAISQSPSLTSQSEPWQKDPEKVRAVSEEQIVDQRRSRVAIDQAGLTRNRVLAPRIVDSLKINTQEIKFDENGRRISPEVVHYLQNQWAAWRALGRIGDLTTLPAFDRSPAGPDQRTVYEQITRARILALNEPTPKSMIECLLRETGMTVAQINNWPEPRPIALTYTSEPQRAYQVLYQIADMIYVSRDMALAKAVQEMGIDFSRDPEMKLMLRISSRPTKERLNILIEELAHQTGKTTDNLFLIELIENEGKPGFEAVARKLTELRKTELLDFTANPDPAVLQRQMAEYEEAAKTKYTPFGVLQLLRVLGDSCDPNYLPTVRLFQDHPIAMLRSDARRIEELLLRVQRVDAWKAKQKTATRVL